MRWVLLAAVFAIFVGAALAEEPLSEARSLAARAGELCEERAYGAAIDAYRKALAVHERVGTGTVEAAGVRAGLGSCLHDAGRTVEARRERTRVLELRRRLAEGDHPDTATSLNDLAETLDALYCHDEALPFREEALAMRKRLFAGDHPDMAQSLNKLGFTYDLLRRHAEALPLKIEALAMRKRLFEGDHPDIARSLNDLAYNHGSRNQFAEALRLHEEALAMRRRCIDGDHVDVADSLGNLAYSLSALGRSEEALGLHEEALAMYRRLFEDDHPAIARGINNVAFACSGLGRHADAFRLNEEALARRRKLYERDHPDTAASLGSLANSMFWLGRLEGALEIQREALAMYRRLFPGDHPHVVRSLGNLAATYAALGRHKEALPLEEEALAIRRRIFGSDHREIADGLGNLAITYEVLGDLHGSLRLREEALAMLRRLFAGDHPGVAYALSNLAAAYQSLGNPAAAVPLDRESLSMYRRIHRGDHPDIAFSLGNLAASLTAFGRASEALPLSREDVAMHRRLFAGDHPYTATSLSNLAHVHRELGAHADALALEEDALAMRRRMFDGDHPDTASSLDALAVTYSGVGRVRDALSMYEEAHAMRRRLFEGDHPRLALSLSNLATAYGHAGRVDEAGVLQQDALAMYRRLFPGDHADVALTLQMLAMHHHALGRPADALPLRREALAIYRRLFGDAHPDVALNLDLLAYTYDAVGRVDDAASTWREAAAAGRETGWPNLHHSLVDLARLSLDAGQATEAERLLEEAIAHLEVRRRGARTLDVESGARYASEIRRIADPFPLMVEVQMARGRPDLALACLERSRARTVLDLLARSREDPLARAERQARRQGDLDFAARIAAAQQAVSDAEVELVRCKEAVRRALETDELVQIRPALRAEGDARRALATAVRRRLQILRESLPAASPQSSPEIQALLEEDERMLAYAIGSRKSYLFLVSPEAVEAVELSGISEKEVVEYGRALAQRGKATREAGARLFRALLPGKVWSAVRGAKRVYVLPHGALHGLPFEALVVDEKGRYWVEAGPPISYTVSGSVLAWLRGRDPARQDLSLVALGDPVFASSRRGWPEKGVLIRSVEPDGQASRLDIRPGDVITGYGAAPVEDEPSLREAVNGAAGSPRVPLRFLRDGEMHVVEAEPGALGIRIALEAPPVAGPKLLEEGEVSARIRGAKTRRERLVRLPGTRREVEQIAGAFRAADEAARVTTLLGRDATEARLYEAAAGARFLHLATHGLVEERKGASFSGLALTLPRVPVPGDDGFLALLDLLVHWPGRLDRTELVVLSACESQRGTLDREEGMLALPLGFCFAGCRSVVGSLWKVDDASTALLMVEFYRRLLEQGGRDKAKALHEARQVVLETHPDPYHWAPFVLLGDPR